MLKQNLGDWDWFWKNKLNQVLNIPYEFFIELFLLCMIIFLFIKKVTSYQRL